MIFEGLNIEYYLFIPLKRYWLLKFFTVLVKQNIIIDGNFIISHPCVS
jgi:hypothetical protein